MPKESGSQVSGNACGTGVVARLAAPRVGPKGQVIRPSAMTIRLAPLLTEVQRDVVYDAEGDGVAVPEEINIAMAYS